MLRKAWLLWKAFGEFLGNLLARLVLTVFYFTIFVPFALGTQLFSDRLGMKLNPTQYWQVRSSPPQSLEEARRQS
jgi:hypothetical protein